MIWDQWYYYMLPEVTDEAYFDPIVPFSALLAVAVSIALSFASQKETGLGVSEDLQLADGSSTSYGALGRGEDVSS